jgi:hypothetical protein
MISPNDFGIILELFGFILIFNFIRVVMIMIIYISIWNIGFFRYSKIEDSRKPKTFKEAITQAKEHYDLRETTRMARLDKVIKKINWEKDFPAFHNVTKFIGAGLVFIGLMLQLDYFS